MARERTPNPRTEFVLPDRRPTQVLLDFLRAMATDPIYTVATLPKPEVGLRVYVSDAMGGACPAYGDGTVFRRYADNTVVS